MDVISLTPLVKRNDMERDNSSGTQGIPDKWALVEYHSSLIDLTSPKHPKEVEHVDEFDIP